METVAVIEKTKTEMVKIIRNESENNFALFRSFSKIAVFNRYFTIGNYQYNTYFRSSKHVLPSAHTHAHKINIFLEKNYTVSVSCV
jgi:hypothetical protein